MMRDAAEARATVDRGLLHAAPADAISRQAGTVIAMLKALDVDVPSARQGWFARLTGADVVNRMRQERALRQVMKAICDLGRGVREGRARLNDLSTASRAMEDDQARVANAIGCGRVLLAQSTSGDLFVRARYERNIAWMTALQSANEETLHRLAFSTHLLVSLLDRLAEVETTLVPLWQRNVLAVLQSPVRPPDVKALAVLQDTRVMLIKAFETAIA
jgi:hypothetical protein